MPLGAFMMRKMALNNTYETARTNPQKSSALKGSSSPICRHSLICNMFIDSHLETAVAEATCRSKWPNAWSSWKSRLKPFFLKIRLKRIMIWDYHSNREAVWEWFPIPPLPPSKIPTRLFFAQTWTKTIEKLADWYFLAKPQRSLHTFLYASRLRIYSLWLLEILHNLQQHLVILKASILFTLSLLNSFYFSMQSLYRHHDALSMFFFLYAPAPFCPLPLLLLC